MTFVSNRVVDLIEHCVSAPTAAAVGSRFLDVLRPFGVHAIFARAYPPVAAHAVQPRIFCQVAPARLAPVYADPRFSDSNPLPRAARQAIEPIRWTDTKARNEREQWVFDSIRDCGFADGLMIPCHGPQGYLGIVSLGFETLAGLAPDERTAIELAATVLHNRMRLLARDGAPNADPGLTARERDCLAFVAEGLSNRRIAEVLGISEPTVATHMAHVRTKLGAKTRSQAVAFFYASLATPGRP